MEKEPGNEMEQAVSQKPEIEVHRIVEGVHLGNDGHGHFTDEARASVPEVGIGVRVWQNSVGATGLEASALGKNTVESAGIDDEGNLTWQSQPDWKDGVSVFSVWGNVGELPSEELVRSEKIGNPGIQWGVIRTTNEDGSQHHFLLAAEFTGEVDNWTVRADIAAIAEPHNAAELRALQIRQLPPA